MCAGEESSRTEPPPRNDYANNADNWTNSGRGAGLRQQTQVPGQSTFPKIETLLQVIAGALIRGADSTELDGGAVSRPQKTLGRVEQRARSTKHEALGRYVSSETLK